MSPAARPDRSPAGAGSVQRTVGSGPGGAAGGVGRDPAPASRAVSVSEVYGSGSGLTAGGATLLMLILCALGAAADLLLWGDLRWGFGGCFLLGCVWSALRLRRRDLAAAVIAPPLVYAVTLLAAAVVSRAWPGGGTGGAGGAGAGLQRNALELVTALALGAPVLLTGTGLAAVIAGTRRLRR